MSFLYSIITSFINTIKSSKPFQTLISRCKYSQFVLLYKFYTKNNLSIDSCILPQFIESLPDKEFLFSFELFDFLISQNVEISSKSYKLFFEKAIKYNKIQVAIKIYENLESFISFQDESLRTIDTNTSIMTESIDEDIFISESSEKSFAKLKSSNFYQISSIFIDLLSKNNQISLSLKYLSRLLKNKNISNENNRIFTDLIEELLRKSIVNSDKILFIETLSLVKDCKPNEIFFNKLIDQATKSNQQYYTDQIYEKMLEIELKPTLVTYNTLIYGYFKANDHSKAWSIFLELKQKNLKPDNFTYTTMINGIKNLENPNINLALSLFDEYCENNKPDQIIYNCLLDACINANQFGKTKEILEKMRNTPGVLCDEITFNTLIKGCGKRKLLEQAIDFMNEMQKIGLIPNRITYNSLIDISIKCGKIDKAWVFYEEMLTKNITPDNFTYSILINGAKAIKTGKEELLKTIHLLETVNKTSPNAIFDEVLYNSLIDACVKFNENIKAFNLFEEMQRKNINPSSITYGILIKAFGKMNDLMKAFKIFEQMKSKNLPINDVTYGCLLDACVKNSRIDLAMLLFEKLQEENFPLNTILFTTLLKGFAKTGKVNEAFELFTKMKENQKTYPNLITYNCLIDACVKNQDNDRAKKVFEELNKEKNIKADLISYSTLIKGLITSGELDKIKELIDNMIENSILPDEMMLNQILETFFNAKKPEIAINLFEKCEKNGFNQCSNITYGLIIKVFIYFKKKKKIKLSILNVFVIDFWSFEKTIKSKRNS